MSCGLRPGTEDKLLLSRVDQLPGVTRGCRSSDWVRPAALPHSSQMDSDIAKLKTCLESICKVLRKANSILCSISQPSVCSEVLISSQGTTYILGVAEVYKVFKRVEGGMKTLNISSEALQQCLRDINLAWNNLQAFLSLCPSVLQMLPAEPNMSCEPNEKELDSSPCPRLSCGVCLMGVPEHTQDLTDAKDSLLLHQGHPYHASCANFWLNCVDTKLPTSSCRRRCDQCVKPLEPTEFPEAKDILESTS